MNKLLFYYLCGVIKQFLHKSISGFLALLVLLSTISFAVEKHYCCDVLIDVSIFTDVERCGVEMEAMLQSKTCCKDEITVFVGQDELKTSSSEDLDFQQQQFLAAFAFSYTNLFEDLSQQIIPHKDYSPPNLTRNIQVLNETFLI